MKALVVRKNDETGKTTASVEDISEDDLPPGDVTIAVEYTTVNYKDGLCLGSGGGLVRNYPHVPGIDFAGTVADSTSERYSVGDSVILTGWRVGESHWGGYAEKARVQGDWLVPTPVGLSSRQAMAIGTAGLTAMLAILALEERGLTKEQGPVLVTGASGGVGSIAVILLASLGYEVAAVTGRPEASEYLTELGATLIVPRDEISDTISRPLESETWSGCVDAVGGKMLARILGQMKANSSVAAVGLAGGSDLPATVIPFLLRGVSLLGIDSVTKPYEQRVIAWQRLAKELPLDKLEDVSQSAKLSDLPRLGKEILQGRVRGRIVVEVGSN